MYGGRGFKRNMYGHGGPYNGGEMGFRSPGPRYQSSPLSGQNGYGGNTPPQQQQQGQGRFPSPNHPGNMKSPPHFMKSPPHFMKSPPHFMKSPPHFMQSPPHYMQSPPHFMQSPPHINEYPSQSPRHRFEFSKSPRGSPRGRGSFPSGAGRGRGSPRHNYNYQNPSPRKDSDCNPGGSSDIGLYYNHNMVEDPWKKLVPVPVSKAAVTTT